MMILTVCSALTNSHSPAPSLNHKVLQLLLMVRSQMGQLLYITTGLCLHSPHHHYSNPAPHPLTPPPPSPGREGLRDTNLVPRAFPLKNGWGKALGARLARYLFLELSDWYQIFSGAPNDGFLRNSLKTLFKAIQRTFRSIEMHSKWRYKICICSVILGQLESF